MTGLPITEKPKLHSTGSNSYTRTMYRNNSNDGIDATDLKMPHLEGNFHRHENLHVADNGEKWHNRNYRQRHCHPYIQSCRSAGELTPEPLQLAPQYLEPPSPPHFTNASSPAHYNASPSPPHHPSNYHHFHHRPVHNNPPPYRELSSTHYGRVNPYIENPYNHQQNQHCHMTPYQRQYQESNTDNQYHQQCSYYYDDFMSSPSPSLDNSPQRNYEYRQSIGLPPNNTPSYLPTSPVPPSSNHRLDNQIYDVGPSDVLCGRGAPSNWNPGNQIFRDLIKQYQKEYLSSKRVDKPVIACKIVDEIKTRGGRFLKRHKSGGVWERGHFVWIDIGDQRAYEKACQALREGAPQIRRSMISKECQRDNVKNVSTDASNDA